MAFGGVVVAIIGIPKVQANMAKATQLHDILARSVVQEHIDRKVIPRAQELTPVDTGDLKGSIRRPGPVRETNKLFLGDIVAGGVKGPVRGKIIDYAAKVHETHPVKSKFIQKAVLEQGRALPGAYKRTWTRTLDGKRL